MANQAHVNVESMDSGVQLVRYLLARGVKAHLPGPDDKPNGDPVQVLVSKPLLKRRERFLHDLLLMVQGWVDDGHASHAEIALRGTEHVVHAQPLQGQVTGAHT